MNSFWCALVILSFWALASFIFAPFVRRASGKSISQSIGFAFWLQGIAISAYILLFLAVGATIFTINQKPVRLTYIFMPTFLCSLISVFPIASLSAKRVLHLADAQSARTLLAGNIAVAVLLWICCWLSPF